MAEPTIKPIGDSIFVIWKEPACSPSAEPRAVLEFSRLAEHRDSLSAEVSVHNGAGAELHWARVNLTSTQGRSTLLKAIEDQDEQDGWRHIVDRSCRMVAKHVRTGEPAQPLVFGIQTKVNICHGILREGIHGQPRAPYYPQRGGSA